MTSKHTPGPWHYRPTGTWPETNHWLGIYAADDVFMMPQVAKVEGYGYISEANARLIAAAPDMLQALKDILAPIAKAQRELEPGQQLSGDAYTILTAAENLREIARAAISKAEGSQP